MENVGEKSAHTAPINENEHAETMNEKRIDESEASSTTRAEHDTPHTEKTEDIAPRTSHHPRFGENQVFMPPTNGSGDADDLPNAKQVGTYDKIELTEDMCYDELGYSFPEWKKWYENQTNLLNWALTNHQDDPHHHFPRASLHELQYQSILERHPRYNGEVQRQRTSSKMWCDDFPGPLRLRMRALGTME